MMLTPVICNASTNRKQPRGNHCYTVISLPQSKNIMISTEAAISCSAKTTTHVYVFGCPRGILACRKYPSCSLLKRVTTVKELGSQSLKRNGCWGPSWLDTDCSVILYGRNEVVVNEGLRPAAAGPCTSGHPRAHPCEKMYFPCRNAGTVI